jgi:glutaredoxin 3
MMKAVMWSKYECSFCDQARELLKLKNYEIEERKIGDGWTKEDLLESVPSARSVPQIFINGNHIGGYDQLVKYIDETSGGYGDAH